MKKILLFIVSLVIFNVSYSNNPNLNSSILLNTTTNNSNTKITLNKNYQQFKYQLINLETSSDKDFASFKKRRRNKQDNLMLYVAGGLAVATATLILTNDPENFTTNSAGSVNLGIAVGGTVGCALFVTKYFIDKYR